jgi:hypothetical protein
VLGFSAIHQRSDFHGMYDLFITHAWRYHDDWKRMVDLLNTNGIRSWRNFSLPWYDPALDARTEDGGRIVRWNLESQIIPSHAIILLTSVYEQPGSRKWLDFEIEMGRKHGKPIIAVPAWGQTQVPAEVGKLADAVVGWDLGALLAAIQQARTSARPVDGDLTAV